MISRIAESLDGFLPSVLVKEVRQGLNSWGFLAQFFGVHAVLAFMTLAQMASLSEGGDGGFGIERGVFWFLVGGYFLFVVPLMSINAVSSEKQGGTIELIRMTGLGPRGVVWGKWLYQAIFIVMVATSVYPYVVIYHFVSGSDVMEESLMLLFLMLGSLILLGISVGASGFGTNNIKSLIFLIVLVILFAGGMGVYRDVRRSSMNLLSIEGLFMVIGIGVPFMLFMLEAAAARVGSRVDGFSFVSRLIGLLLFIVPTTLLYLDIFPEFCLVICFLIVILVPWFALMGAPIMVAGPYRRYQRFGELGKWLGRFFFYPGWVSGTPYATVIVVIFAGIVLGQAWYPTAISKNGELEEMLYVMTSLAMFPFQLCLVRALFQKHETDWALSKVLSVHIGLLLFAFGLGFLKVYFGINLTPWFSFIPSNAFIFSFFGAFSSSGGLDFVTHQLFAYIGHVSIIVALMLLGQRYWFRYAELEARAAVLNEA